MCFLSQQDCIVKMEVLRWEGRKKKKMEVLLYYFYHQFLKMHSECELIAFLRGLLCSPLR